MAQKRRDNKVIIISLITVICTWCGSCSSDRAFTDNYTVDNVATSYKPWVVREFLMSIVWRRRKKRSERAEHLLKKLIIVYKSAKLTSTIEAVDIYYLLSDTFSLFWEQKKKKKTTSKWNWSTLDCLFPNEMSEFFYQEEEEKGKYIYGAHFSFSSFLTAILKRHLKIWIT